jgi:KAP-like P-loop domain-containing protein/WD40 domain-containing protein
LSANGTAVASADDGGTICVWDAAGGSLLKSAKHGAAVRALAFSKDGRFVASGGDDGFVNLWRVDEMLQVGRLGHGGAQIIDVAFDINGISLEAIANDSVARRWELFTEPPIAPSYLTDYVPKQPVPSWIDDDVDAFARLVASRHMSPPLSIGIFGDWGSGKTFFMRSLQQRVAQLAHEASQSGLAQRDVGYYKHIAQVEFNAWHYAGADLWASLVENIFTKLWIGRDEQRAQVRLEALFRESRVEDTRAAHEASLEVALLRDQEASAKRRAKELEDKAANVENKRDALRAREKNAVNRFVRSLSQAAREALTAAGFEELGQTPAEVEAAIAKARDMINRESFLITLARAVDRRRRLVWLIAATVGSVAVAIVVRALVPLSTVRDAAASIAGAITLLSTVTLWVQKQYDWLKRQRTALALANTKDQVAQNRLAKEAASIDADRMLVKEDETRLAGELAIAHERERLAIERLERREDEIRSGNPAALLARLIGDRAEGDFYREHLGLLALIRRDFEAISNFVEKDRLELENEHLAPLEETAQDARRINRIVLYIDDLDRCPPDVVVKVLEAIHLLLSFPMFVVVVGVDARWVSRALAIKYPDLLPEKPKPGEPAATPFDYLEKIFQVPYWIEPLSPDQTRQLVETLVGRKLRRDSGSIAPTAPIGAEASNALGGIGQPSNGNVGPEAQERGVVRPEDLNAKAMELTSEELVCFDELAPLLGRSPRALKRFLNIYRLLRTKAYYEGFAEDRGPPSDYRIVAFLLAVITSHPANAYALFSELLDDRLPARSLVDIVTAAARANPALEPIRVWLQLPANATWSSLVQPMRDWTREVMRYSFRPEPRSSESVLGSNT